MTIKEIFHRASEILERLHSIAEQLAEVEARFRVLEAKLSATEPETAYQHEAAQFLRRSARTLMRWRDSGKLQQGIHWWPEDGNGAPIYNLRLIRDGQRQGFDSPAHRSACKQWLKQQPSNQKRRA